MHRFAALDDNLIDRMFQPLADRIAGRFGIGRFRAATLCIDGAALAWLLSQAGALAEAVSGGGAAACWMPALTLLLGLVALTSLRTLFQRASGGRTTANPLRQAMRLHRAAVLLLLLARLARLGYGVSFADAADSRDAGRGDGIAVFRRMQRCAPDGAPAALNSTHRRVERRPDALAEDGSASSQRHPNTIPLGGMAEARVATHYDRNVHAGAEHAGRGNRPRG